MPEGKIVSKALEVGLIKDIFTYRQVCSAQHEKCSGKIFCVFLTAEQLLTNQERAVELVIEACRQAKEWGAEIVGLGAMTAVVGSRGKEINQHSPVPVTTGNSLTVYSSLRAYRDIVKKLGIDIHRQKIVIVGFPGSIGLAIARLLIQEGVNLLLVSRGKTPFIERFLASLDEEAKKRVEINNNLKDALGQGKIVFSATSTGSIIDPDTLAPGSIIFDIAQPRDVIQKKEKRKDVLIIDAGTITLPRTNRHGYHSISLPFFSFLTIPIMPWQTRGHFYINYSGVGPIFIPSCLGETITLALENRPESFSLGRELDLDRIREIGALSEKHGFVFDHFVSFDKSISDQTYEATAKALKQSN